MPETVQGHVDAEPGIAAALRPLARDIDRRGRLSADAVQQLSQSGLIDLAGPAGDDFHRRCHAILDVARGAGTVGWCFAAWAAGGWLTREWPRAVREQLRTASTPIVSGVIGPWIAQAVPGAGDVVLDGRWDLAVGAEHAQWLILPCTDPTGEVALALVETSELRLSPTRPQAGLRGAATSAVSAEAVVIAAERLLAGRALSAAARELTPFAWSAAIIGMAAAAVDAFEERLRGGAANVSGTALADVPTLQLRLARADAEVACARAVVFADLNAVATGGARDTLDGPRRARNRAYATRLCVKATDGLFDVSGAAGLSAEAPIQRIHRDVHTAAHAPQLAWQPAMRRYARLRSIHRQACTSRPGRG